jgi:hypothetical protein
VPGFCAMVLQPGPLLESGIAGENDNVSIDHV